MPVWPTGYAEFFRVKQDIDISNFNEHEALVSSICVDMLACSPLYVRAPPSDEPRPALANLMMRFKECEKVRVED